MHSLGTSQSLLRPMERDLIARTRLHAPYTGGYLYLNFTLVWKCVVPLYALPHLIPTMIPKD